jgi:hypothetical protein
VALDDRWNLRERVLDEARGLTRVLIDSQRDEDGQALPEGVTIYLGAVARDHPSGFERFGAPQASGRRQRYRISEIDVGDPPILLQPGDDGTIDRIKGAVRHSSYDISDLIA